MTLLEQVLEYWLKYSILIQSCKLLLITDLIISSLLQKMYMYIPHLWLLNLVSLFYDLALPLLLLPLLLHLHLHLHLPLQLCDYVFVEIFESEHSTSRYEYMYIIILVRLSHIWNVYLHCKLYKIIRNILISCFL